MIVLAAAAAASEQDLRDLDRALDRIEARYAYLDPSVTDLPAARAALEPRALAATTDEERVRVFEALIESLVDPHASLGTNLPSSTRLVPSGLDVWVEPDGSVTAVRAGWPADAAGLRPGDRIVAIGGVPLAEAIAARIPVGTNPTAPAVRAWATLALLAGTHDTPRVVALADGRTVALGDPDQVPARPVVTWELRPDGVGVVALHAVGDSASVPAFDEALDALRGARGLVVDLRDTAAGGSTAVAEPILGRFVRERAGYQRVVRRSGAARVREVSPRGPWTWDEPVAVLVDRWTGSMGEGMAIGFDALGVGTVMGTEMAGLKGAVRQFPTEGFSYQFPTLRLTHVDGTPREAWRPPVRIEPGTDAVAAAAAWILAQP